jgi:protein-arginine kinase activator protein McsA
MICSKCGKVLTKNSNYLVEYIDNKKYKTNYLYICNDCAQGLNFLEPFKGCDKCGAEKGLMYNVTVRDILSGRIHINYLLCKNCFTEMFINREW